MIAEDKVLFVPPVMFLETKISLAPFQPAKPTIDFPNPLTLNTFQSFFDKY